MAKGEGEAKRETMQESESEKTDATLVKQIQKFEAQKTRAHPILPMAEGKSVSLYSNWCKIL